MILQLSYYSVTMLVTTIALGILAGYVWKRRSVPGGTYFSLLMALMAGWVLVSALEYSAAEVSAKIIFAKLAFAGGVSIPPMWLLFALEYCYPDRRMDKKWIALLWVLPTIAAILTVTNEYHGLIWSSILSAYTGYVDTLIYTRGIAAWAITFYSFIVATPGFILLFRKALRTAENNHPWPVSLLIGSISVLLLSGVSQYLLIAGYGIDLTPLALAVMGIVFAWGVFRHHIFELMPVAAEKLIENMSDGVLVLNKKGAIVKINAAARRKFGVSEAVLGQPAEKALAEWPRLAECLDDKSGSPFEIAINEGEDGERRWIDARASHLQDERARPLGTLIILRDITERKLNEEALKKSEYDRLKAEELANIGYFDLNLGKFEAQVSEGCARIYGFPAGTTTVSYKKFLGRIHPDDVARVGQEIKAIMEQGIRHPLEYRIVQPDGSIRYLYSESEVLVRDAAGAPARQFGIVQDITERKLSEQSLRKSEADRARAEQIAHLGYYEWDVEKRVAKISEGCTRIFGFPADTTTITYDMFTGKIHPEDRGGVIEHIHACVTEGAGFSLEFRIVLPDGSIRHIHSVSEEVIPNATGATARQFGIVQDITERKHAEEVIRLTEERYRTIVETANESICIIDKDTRLSFINSKAAEMLGYKQEEMIGRSVYEFTDPRDHELLGKNLVEKRGGKKEQASYRLRRKDGSILWGISSSSPLYNDKGEVTGLLAMLTDITEIKLADEQLKVSLKEKEALLKEVHHRVKNNLQIITSLLNLQSSGRDDPKYLDLIRDSQNRVKSMALVHEYLYKSESLSNISTSEYLKSLTGNVARSYGHSAGNVALRTDIEDISIDVDRAVPIGIIVTELVSNAYKYAFPGGKKGEISVELRRDGGKIVLTISDNGVGLPEGFDIRKTSTLGLQLVEMLAQQIEGVLEIERAERTIFRISLKD